MRVEQMAKRKRKRKAPTADAKRLLKIFLTGKGRLTAQAYGTDLRRFADFLEAKTVDGAVAELIGGGNGQAYELASLYRAHLRERSAAATINRRLATLRSLTSTARNIGIIAWSLTIKPLPTQPLRDSTGPGRSNVRRMIEFAKATGGLKGYRDTAILYLLYGLALRRGEVVELDAENVDLKRPALSVIGKGRVEREWIDMPLLVAEAVAAWMSQRGHDDGPLFYTLSRAYGRERLSATGLYSIVVAISKAIGCKTTPHGLRHTAITDAILLGHSLADVQKFSRHANLNTLQIYFDRVRGVAVDIASSVVNGL